MDTNLTAALASERHDRMVTDAAAFRRARTGRAVKPTRTNHQHSRVVAFLKDIVAASL